MSTVKVIIITLLVGIGLLVWGYQSKKEDNSVTTTITTTEWVAFKTDGRKFDLELMPVNGIVGNFVVSVNDKLHSQTVKPKVFTYLGPESDIKVVYCHLEDGQGYEKAHLKLTFRN